MLPAGLPIDTVGDSHALGGIGQHEHRPRLQRSPRGDQRGPEHARQQRQKCCEAQEHKRAAAAGGNPRPVGGHAPQHRREEQRHHSQKPPGTDRIEVDREIPDQAERIHAPTSSIVGSGGGAPGSGGGAREGAGVAAAGLKPAVVAVDGWASSRGA